MAAGAQVIPVDFERRRRADQPADGDAAVLQWRRSWLRLLDTPELP